MAARFVHIDHDTPRLLPSFSVFPGPSRFRKNSSALIPHPAIFLTLLISLLLGNPAEARDHPTRPDLGPPKWSTGVSPVVTTLSFAGGLSVQEYQGSATTPSVETIRGSDYGGGIGGVLYTIRGSARSHNAYNSRGDVVSQTNESAIITWQAAYEAFGTRTQEEGATADRQKANTKDEDPTGLLNEGMRYRDLEFGIFLTRDPAGFVDGPNVYTYVRQNPWTFFDPLGLDKRGATDRLGEIGWHFERMVMDVDPVHALEIGALGIELACETLDWGIDSAAGDKKAGESVIEGASSMHPMVAFAQAVEQFEQEGITKEAAAGVALNLALRRIPGLKGSADDALGAAAKHGDEALEVGAREVAEDAAGEAANRLGTLTRAGDNVWDSAGGLRYAGTDRAGLNRVQHVLRHAEADPSRTTHSVFNVGRNKVLGLVDEAWGMRGSPLANDPGAYVVPMGRTVGTAGENAVKIIVRPGTNEVITSYPIVVP